MLDRLTQICRDSQRVNANQTHSSGYRILKGEGLHRLPRPSPTTPRQPPKAFKPYDLGFIHIDIKHLPKLHVIGQGPRKRYLYVAADGSPGGQG